MRSRTGRRLYPWGDSFDKARGNTRESGIGATTPVGRYPSGASPYDAQDMAGNVWEWTSSLYQAVSYSQNDGREDRNSTENRVLRGGSWGVDARDARAACRYRRRLDVLVDDNGFRLAVARGAGWFIMIHCKCSYFLLSKYRSDGLSLLMNNDKTHARSARNFGRFWRPRRIARHRLVPRRCYGRLPPSRPVLPRWPGVPAHPHARAGPVIISGVYAV